MKQRHLTILPLLASAILLAGCGTPSTQSLTNTIVNTTQTITRSFSAGLQLPVADTTTFTTTTSGLQYKDITSADAGAAVAKAGDLVTVDYTGMLPDGTQFDSSLTRGSAFQFNLGAGQVIKGWDEGVAGMAVGQERILVIPSDLGYGAAGAGGVIPGNATLQFQVKLEAIQ